MTPKERAEQLVKRYSKYDTIELFESKGIYLVKQICIDHVDEIIHNLLNNTTERKVSNEEINYYKEVKQELNKL